VRFSAFSGAQSPQGGFNSARYITHGAGAFTRKPWGKAQISC